MKGFRGRVAAHKTDLVVTSASAEAFANYIAQELNKELSRMTFSKPSEGGIGIHFSAYERVDDYWVPEMFLISNWRDTSYTSLRETGVGYSRETYHTVHNVPRSIEHGKREYRLDVHRYLEEEGRFIGFNNGDPGMFNTAVNALFDQFRELARRGHLKDAAAIRTHLNMARRPVEMVSNTQADFCESQYRTVGGKPHDLAVSYRHE